MLRRSGLVKDCLIVCNARSKAKAASTLELDADVSELPNVAPVELGLDALGVSSDSEARRVDRFYRHWLRLWSVNCLL
jgi:hypothetical protein